MGVKIFEPYNLQEIAGYIDWQPFFITWEMHGKFPQILSDEVIGEAASRLYADAQALLKKSPMKNG
jgi:5-methyltetrahydrofolate--homocysteine methyltransferase